MRDSSLFGKNQRIQNIWLISLPWVHYNPAKPTTHRPRHWNISSGIASVQASVTIDIDKQLSKPLNSFRVSFFSMVYEWWVVP